MSGGQDDLAYAQDEDRRLWLKVQSREHLRELNAMLADQLKTAEGEEHTRLYLYREQVLDALEDMTN